MTVDRIADDSLNDDERDLLRRGLLEWAGPARCTEELAVAMGFTGIADMLTQSKRIRAALAADERIEAIDWARALMATEIAFASDVIGSGVEWATTTGLSDESTIKTLRLVQRKLVRIVAPLVGDQLGTRS
ncbi:hypothetical protein [Salinispora pacifica]|uniref:hypothetical protein n=1 Tax=Salinispora pacifica TaxID=351187 RepID=UPI0009B79004|nr:hypothetical protein [Salinispora pacifica]